MMSYFGYSEWAPYVPVAERRRRALSKLTKLKKKGEAVAPVTIEGRIIAKSFWGKSWCTNLERYSDYENRLPRGRSYVRNGSVLDLRIAKGEVVAMVAGSDLYKVKATIAPVKASRWKAICRDCAGTIDSLVELLQGRLAKGVMDRVCREGDGLFPAPGEIKLSCSCPDWADMCKHVAAVLYGVGARLDQRPQLLFVLRGVDENELLAGAGPNLSLAKSAGSKARVLDETDMAALFGLEMADNSNPDSPIPAAPKPSRPSSTAKRSKADVRTAPPTAKTSNPTHRKRAEAEPAREALVSAGKRAKVRAAGGRPSRAPGKGPRRDGASVDATKSRNTRSPVGSA
jgi:uncharacterized Zn finger protein